MAAATQLPLNLGLRDEASFANYLAGPNREALHAVEALVHGEHRFLYLWGTTGSGKTHLLHAACQAVSAVGARCAYLPLNELRTLGTDVLEGLEQLALVCVDDVQSIATRPEWETELFHLYNRLRETGAILLAAGDAPPSALGLSLPDLSSRLAWGLVLQLQPLNDAEKISALQLRARNRGLELPAEVGSYLLRHWPRDMPRLFELLQRLDTHSLTRQRKLTIPLVRELIAHETAQAG